MAPVDSSPPRCVFTCTTVHGCGCLFFLSAYTASPVPVLARYIYIFFYTAFGGFSPPVRATLDEISPGPTEPSQSSNPVSQSQPGSSREKSFIVHRKSATGHSLSPNFSPRSFAPAPRLPPFFVLHPFFAPFLQTPFRHRGEFSCGPDDDDKHNAQNHGSIQRRRKSLEFKQMP